ncbi:hypothetical protein [Opitutus terrae]|uniref:Porin n=1 Tax=Opitutus terrae (strain DSM 11246 / JCM 15787 / PB90-1) TaxID=452637 RepID=B1ZQ56_OPITP|nr:hypothetical protein [Opitutus terrae]ACB77777.1 hypothetical protein Oter_4506 [Opitutus terrae PB90-1]
MNLKQGCSYAPVIGVALSLFSAAIAVGSPALEIHGAVSATAGYSDRYNYLGDTKDTLDMFSNEVTLNGTHRFANGIRFGAQIYGYRLDDFRDLTVDFAQFDYSFNEAFGLRLGRGKQAVGLYGDTQDIDIIRPLALLPLNAYPKTMRTNGASYDGAAIYGSIALSGAGSLDYHVYGGMPAKYRAEDPWLLVMNDSAPATVTEVEDLGRLFAGSVYWNTPLSGLKIGGSVARTTGTELAAAMRSAASLAMAAGDVRLMPTRFPPGMWDNVIAGRPAIMKQDAVTHYVYSAEYTRGDWVFAGEYRTTTVHSESNLPVLGPGSYSNRMDNFYVMATWQAAAKWQLAAFYEEGYANTHDRRGRSYSATPAHHAWTKETCAAVSYNLTDWWLVKLQAHAIDGTALLSGRYNPAIAQWKSNWTYVVLKTTISF